MRNRAKVNHRKENPMMAQVIKAIYSLPKSGILVKDLALQIGVDYHFNFNKRAARNAREGAGFFKRVWDKEHGQFRYFATRGISAARAVALWKEKRYAN